MESQLKQQVGFFHPTRRFYRYTVLAVVSLICFGSYFAFDEIQPLANDLEKVSPDLTEVTGRSRVDLQNQF
jgi:hypothetical protein